MAMIHDVQQGTQQWKDLRAKYFTASEAPAALGFSKYQSRNDLLKQKATGIEPDHSPATQALFQRGHDAEAAARSIAEEIIGEELYPGTVTEEIDGLPLLASLDGLNMAGDIVWEHKLYSASLAAQVKAGELEQHYVIQLEQQAMVTGAKKVLFVCSDGSPDNCEWMWYEPNPMYQQQIVNGWRQFIVDLDNYQHVEEAPEVVAAPVQNLPALLIDLAGEVKDTNLVAYSSAVAARIQAINTDLQTDQDFIDAQEMVKFLKKAEDEVETAKKMALAKTASIEELFSTVDHLREEMRSKRLELDKLVKARKEAIRHEILQGGKAALQEHITKVNSTLEGVTLPMHNTDFAGVMKGKRTIASLRDAVDTELARAKIETNAWADEIRANLKAMAELAGDYRFLFSDLQQIILKPNDDFTAQVKLRIAEHREAEAKRLEQEREQIRQEEERKAKQKAEAEAAEKERIRQEEERKESIRLQAEEDAKRKLEEQAAEDAKAVQEAEQRGAEQAVQRKTSHPKPTTQVASYDGVNIQINIEEGAAMIISVNEAISLRNSLDQAIHQAKRVA